MSSLRSRSLGRGAPLRPTACPQHSVVPGGKAAPLPGSTAAACPAPSAGDGTGSWSPWRPGRRILNHQRNFRHMPHSHPRPHPPPRSAATEVTGVGPWALLGAGSVEPTAAVCQPWDSVPSLRHGLLLLNWAKTTSWPHGGAVSPSRRAVPSGLVTRPLGRFGPSPGLRSGCAPFSHAGGDREGRGAPAVQDHRQPLGGRLPPRAEQRAGRTPPT